jgi:hypothetical protein
MLNEAVAMKIFGRLFNRRDREISDRPSVRGPLIVVNVNFFGLDAHWLRGLLRRRRIAPPRPTRPISMQSSFLGGGRARALAELDGRIESRGFDRGSAPVVEEAPATEPAPPVRILLGRPGRER